MDLKIAPQTVQRQAVEKLRSAITMGVFKPGERLVEGQICAMLGVSRTSVREALRSLEAERLIQLIPNRGPVVSSLTWKEAEEIYEIRAMLEGRAAESFSQKATNEQVQELFDALRGFKEAVRADDSAVRLAETSRFYDVIIKGAGHALIDEMLQGLLARITLLRQRSMSRLGRSRISAKEMEAIARAIKARDPEAARIAAIHHVEEACRAAKQAFEAMEEEIGAGKSVSARKRGK